MTPKEKAKELVKRFEDGLTIKDCALIAVDEILEMDLPILEEEADKFYEYWEQVKHEIQKL